MKYALSSQVAIRRHGKSKCRVINAAAGTSVVGPAWLAALCAQLIEAATFSKRQFQAIASSLCETSDAESLFLRCLVGEVIVPARGARGQWREARYDWDEFGWSAAKILHAATLDTPFFLGDEEGVAAQSKANARTASGGQGPGLLRALKGSERVALPEPSPPVNDSFSSLLLGRRTRRFFSPSTPPITADQLAALLHYVARAQKLYKHPAFGTQMLRTSPSGGARHPVEIYPQVLRGVGVRSGSYYYNPVQHTLHRLGEVSPNKLHLIGQAQAGCLNMPLAFLITARFARNLWKYRYAKSYNFTWLDVGHFAQTLLLVAESFGLNCFLTPAVNLRVAHKYLRLKNPFDECCVYIVSVG